MSLIPSRNRSKQIGAKIGSEFVTRDTLMPKRRNTKTMISNEGAFHAYKRGVLVIGDSMLRHFDPIRTNQNIWLFSYPGMTIGQLTEHLQHEYLPCERHVRLVFLHIGTNNASQQRANQSVTSIIDEYKQLIERIGRLYPHCEIWCSGILPRLDDDQSRGVEINRKLKQLEINGTKLNFVDLSIQFTDESGAPLEDMFKPDQVHLSKTGNELLQTLIDEFVRHNLRPFKGDRSLRLKSQTEWDTWREETIGTFNNSTRFCVTNWDPDDDIKQNIDDEIEKRMTTRSTTSYNTGRVQEKTESDVDSIVSLESENEFEIVDEQGN